MIHRQLKSTFELQLELYFTFELQLELYFTFELQLELYFTFELQCTGRVADRTLSHPTEHVIGYAAASREVGHAMAEQPRLDALLIYPPMDPTLEAPPAGLSYLAGHALARGYRCEILDLNLELTHSLLGDATHIARCAAVMRERLERFHASPALAGRDVPSYARTLRLAALGSLHAGALGQALESCAEQLRRADARRLTLGCRRAARDGAGRDALGQDYAGDLAELVWLAYRLDLEAASKPEDLPVDETDPAACADYLAHMVKQIRAGERATYFAEQVRSLVLPYVQRRAPTLLGISLCSLRQITFGVELAALLRHALPELPIIFGGNQCIYADALFARTTWLGSLVDALVVGEGESVLLACIEAARRPVPTWDGIAGVASYRHQQLVRPERPEQGPLDVVPSYPIASLRTPRASYFTERRDLLAGRGCYWARCRFCTHGLVYGRDYRPCSAEATVRTLRELGDRDGVHDFYFVDEALAPKTVAALTDSLLEEGIELRWACYLRAERGFTDRTLLARMRRAGCELVEIGVESASQRVLDAMDKGIELATVRSMLDGLLAEGIAVNAFLVIGFPTETEAEASETVSLVREYSARGVHFLPSPFELARRSRALQERHALGIELLLDEPSLRAFWVLEEGRHYRLRSGIGHRRACAIAAQIARLAAGAPQPLPRLDDDTTLVRYRYCGASPTGFPVDLQRPSPAAADLTRQPPACYFEVLGEGGLVVPEPVLAFVELFASPERLGAAIERFCADMGASVMSHGSSLRALAHDLASARVLTVVAPARPSAR